MKDEVTVKAPGATAPEPRWGTGGRERLCARGPRLPARPPLRSPTRSGSQGAAEGSHTAIFKTDKNRACPTVSRELTEPGAARARPDELVPAAPELLGWRLARPQLLRASSQPAAGAGGRGLPEPPVWPNGNTPPLDSSQDPLKGVSH